MYTTGRGRGIPNVYQFNYTQSNAGGYSSSMDSGGSSSSYPTRRTRSPLKIHVIQATAGEGIHT
jgi:hypothetical protein